MQLWSLSWQTTSYLDWTSKNLSHCSTPAPALSMIFTVVETSSFTLSGNEGGKLAMHDSQVQWLSSSRGSSDCIKPIGHWGKNWRIVRWEPIFAVFTKTCSPVSWVPWDIWSRTEMYPAQSGQSTYDRSSRSICWTSDAVSGLESALKCIKYLH